MSIILVVQYINLTRDNYILRTRLVCYTMIEECSAQLSAAVVINVAVTVSAIVITLLLLLLVITAVITAADVITATAVE